MKISAYEIILPLIGTDDKIIEEKTLLVNGLYGALDVVDTKVAKELEKGHFKEIPFSLLESLATRGHITRKSKDEEISDAKLLGRIWNSPRISTIIILILMSVPCGSISNSQGADLPCT